MALEADANDAEKICKLHVRVHWIKVLNPRNVPSMRWLRLRLSSRAEELVIPGDCRQLLFRKLTEERHLAALQVVDAAMDLDLT